MVDSQDDEDDELGDNDADQTMIATVAMTFVGAED